MSRKVLYDVRWQKMRVSFLGAHHASGGFTTPAGTLDNLQRMNQYLSDPAAYEPLDASCNNYDEAYACRVWRCLNLLNATRMGYQGQGKAGSEMDEAVRTYRDRLQDQHNPHVLNRVDARWSWEVIHVDLELLWRNERYWFKAIHDDLKRRKRTTEKKREGDLSHRNELVTFLNLMEQVNILPS